jgi:hypothetical protein
MGLDSIIRIRECNLRNSGHIPASALHPPVYADGVISITISDISTHRNVDSSWSYLWMAS